MSTSIYYDEQNEKWKLRYFQVAYGSNMLVSLYDENQKLLIDKEDGASAVRSAEKYLDKTDPGWNSGS